MTRKGPGNNPTAKDPFGFETQSGTHFGAGASYHCHVEGQDNTLQPCGTADNIRDNTNSRGFPTGAYNCWAIARDLFFCLVGGLKKPNKGQEER